MLQLSRPVPSFVPLPHCRHVPLLPHAQREKLAYKIVSLGPLDERDNFLSKLQEKLQKYQVQLPSVTIEYRGLHVETDANMGKGEQGGG